MDFVSFVMVSSMWRFQGLARAIAAVKEVKVLETNQQGIRGRNTLTPNVIYHYVL